MLTKYLGNFWDPGSYQYASAMPIYRFFKMVKFHTVHPWIEDDLKVYKTCKIDCKMEIKLRLCELELIGLTDEQFQKYLYDFLDIHKYIENEVNIMTLLLHILPLFSVPGQEKKKTHLLIFLTRQLAVMSEHQLYSIYINYLDQLMTRNSTVSEEDLCIREIHPYYELQLKLCYAEKLIKQEKYQLYKELICHNVDLITSMIQEMKTREDHITMTQTCKFLAHIIDIDTSCQLPSLLRNHENFTFLLPELLSMLKKVNSKMKNPLFELLYQLFLCRKQINENEGDADLNIIARCLNNFIRKKFRENQTEFIALIISITDILSENSFLKKLLQRFLRQCLKTVNSATATSVIQKKEFKWIEIFNYSDAKSKKDLIYAQYACIVSGKRMRNVDTNQYLRKLNLKGPEDENDAETQSEQVKLLILFILLLLVTALGHKSAKLKKYLALKYEYHMACLYLLWCSGDIEVHPGPPWRTKQLEHESEIKRKWLQDINSILLKLYWEIPTQSKPKNLWQKDNQPEQWPLDKPFYDTKNASKDAEGNKITDDEILTCLLECLKQKEVDIPHIYQSEISAWTNDNIQLLHKLQVFRIEMENVKSASFILYLSNLEDNTQNLQDIKVSLEKSTLSKMQIEGLLNKDRRQKKQAEMVAEITRDLASILCRLAKGTDPMEKGDGTWNTPPVDWPEDVPFFNPKNRGKNKSIPKCPDTVLVCTFLKLQHLRIPENLKQIVDAYQTMYNCTDIDVKKKNKDELCRLYTIQSNLEKLDCSLQNLHKEGLFSREVNAMLNQWWETQSVDKHADHDLKSVMVRSDERPYVTIDITKNFEQDTDLRYISYSIPLKDAYLHIKCTKIHTNQSSHEQTITGPLVPANNLENIEDSVIPPDVIDFVLEHDFVNQTKCSYVNSVMNTDNGRMTFDLQRQGTPLPITHQHQTDLDTLTTHNTLASDLNGSRCTTEYVTSVRACYSEYNSSGSTGENLGGNMGTSTVKRKQIEDSEEPVKKLLKTNVNQLGHYNSTDEEISSPESKNDGGSQKPNYISTSNQHDSCSANVQDLQSLEFSLSDIIDSIGDNCNSKSSEDSESLQQICDLESINNSNQQDSHENINELNYIDNQMDQTDDKTELEKCLEMIKYLSR